MGLVEYKGLLMDEDVVEQLKLRHEQDDSGRWDNEAAEIKQNAEIKQTVERKQTYEFMQNDVSKDSDISGIGCNSGEAANKEEMDFVSKHTNGSISIILMSGDLHRWQSLRRRLCRSRS